MNEDRKIMLKNKIHEIKYFIRDELTLEELLDIKQILEDAIDAKEDIQNDVTTQEVKFYFEETFIGDQKWEIIADFLNEKYEGETKEVMRKDIRKQCKDRQISKNLQSKEA